MGAETTQPSLLSRVRDSADDAAWRSGSAILDPCFPHSAPGLATLLSAEGAQRCGSSCGEDAASGSSLQFDNRKMSATFVVGHGEYERNGSMRQQIRSRIDAPPLACWEEILVDLQRRSAIK